VYPIQSFVRDSCKGANDVVLASQEEDEGKLRQRDIAGSVANVLKVEEVAQVQVEKAKNSDQYKMSEDDCKGPNSWQREREAAES